MCCLFGLIDYKHRFSGKQKSRILNTLAVHCQVRGTDATGIAYNRAGRLSIYKRPLPAHRMKLRVPGEASVVMGHTRMTTQGSEKRNQNNHPFPGRLEDTTFALAHNGVLYNDELLRTHLDLPETSVETDSYVAVQLIEQQRALTFDSLKSMAEQVMGTFVFTVLDRGDNLYFVKGDNPFCLYHYPKLGIYLYASTEEILKKALGWVQYFRESPISIPLKEGEILRVDPQGKLSRATFDAQPSRYGGWGVPYRYERWMSPLWQDGYDGGEEYLIELKSVASSYGYTPEDIDHILQMGLSLDEISELIYCGEI